jgi:hypothetical protein
MRHSIWRITWNPLGSSPVVLLDHGDLMEREIVLDGVQAADARTFDMAITGRPAARGNRRGRLEIGRVIQHETAAESWHECARQAAAGPWDQGRGMIQVQPIAGEAVLMHAVQISSSHRPTADAGLPESVHERVLRVARLLPTASDGITIIGGWFNPPTSGGGITVVIPGGSGLTPGSAVHVTGIPGVVPGYYTVTGVKPGAGGGGGGSGTDEVTLEGVDHDEPGQSMPQVSFEHALPSSDSITVRIARTAEVTSTVPFEALRKSGTWDSFIPGTWTFSETFAEIYAPGSWAGLSPSSGPREVTYLTQMATLTWRRIGGGSQTFTWPVRAEGEVSYESGIGGNQTDLLPAAPFSITAFSEFSPEGSINGGTITPVTLP